MNRTKIVWITFNAFIDTDIYIVAELIKHYDIKWYIIRSDNDKYEYENEIQKLCEEGANIELLVCGKRLRSPSCIRFYHNLLREIKNEKPDILYASLAGAPYFIPMLPSSIGKAKTVLAIHNAYVPRGGSNYYFFQFYNRLALRKYHYFQTFSESQYEYLRTKTKNKEVVCIPFILKDYGAPSGERINDDITFLNFGNIRPYKRIDVLIKAAQMAYEATKKKFKVIIAGKCDNWDIYQNLIVYPELFDIRLGRVENDDIPELFNECDYFVAPYQDIAQSGSSIIAVNYLKPIIASKLPAFEEYIHDGQDGYLMKPADVESLKNIIIRLLKTHSSEYEHIQNNLKRMRDNTFSKQVIVNQYKEFLNEISSR